MLEKVVANVLKKFVGPFVKVCVCGGCDKSRPDLRLTCLVLRTLIPTSLTLAFYRVPLSLRD